MMNYLDLIIIYLSCGSPLGVYYFFNNRQHDKTVWLKSVLITCLWIPYALTLLHKKVTKKLKNNTFYENDVYLSKLQKGFEDFLPENSLQLSLFELREILERYSELTLITFESNGIPAKHEKEIFLINGDLQNEIPSICLNRRNHKRLIFHQTQARIDFLKTLKILINSNSDLNKLEELSSEFAKALNDKTALTYIKDLFQTLSQTDKVSSVTLLENDLWKPIEPTQLNEKQISIPMQVMTVTANIRKKD